MSCFRVTQLRRAFRVVNGGTPTADPANWDGDVPWATPVDLAAVDGGELGSTQRRLTRLGLRSGSAAVDAGTLILSTRAPIGYVTRPRTLTAFNQGCKGLAPTQPLDTRYFTYQLLALRQVLLARGNGSTFSELSADALASTPVAIPLLATQRAIADYLDSETSRIDALTVKKRKLIEVANERRDAIIEASIRALAEKYGSVPLKHAVRRVEVGIVITPSAWYLDVGVLALRGLNIRSGTIDLDDVVYISDEGHRLHKKSMLHAGDVVVVRTGQAGAAAAVPATLDGCNCIDLVIVRPSQRLMSRFLEFVLNSDWTQKHIDQYSVGTIQSHFNVGAMKEVPVPIPPRDEQHHVVAQLDVASKRAYELTERLSKQIELLSEHRQALITAAVTGDLDLPGMVA